MENLSLPNHPSKLMPDGRIIYIGGLNQSNPGDNATRLLMTEIYVFDTVQSTWSLKIANSPDSVNIDPRVGHTAVLGNITNDFGPSNNASAEVYLMDLSNYKWVKQFGKTDNNELIIIICSIVVGLVIICTIIWLFVRKRWNNYHGHVVHVDQNGPNNKENNVPNDKEKPV
ncbi:hypothetical protein C2G38_2046952 [Gigaspora rosea]|uniref:Galactose oxidase n=1 Tax=Gigaspora rosea TaxID=44941 RepID=A0A397UAV6_9GLOM|nr:hypothetical protein C2G38_2046952 [Gigaspora rosea]